MGFLFKKTLLYQVLHLVLILSIIASCAAMNHQNYTFAEDNLVSNMIITSKYALIGKINQPQPTLKKLNFETMKLKTIVYEPVDDWVNIGKNYLADLKNGDIAFGIGFHVFILNN
jgi:hypothetical protein